MRMKYVYLTLVFLFVLNLNAQESAEIEVQKTVERFFEGFHKQDSTMMKETVGNNPILQTVGRNKDGKAMVRTETFDRLIQSITSIPDSVNFQEKLKSFNIQIDGDMANAWTPYEFWLNDAFHHCGVNSFQLFNDGGTWKIIYLIDTRRREGCD